MNPSAEVAARFTRVEGFVQREPRDGAPSSQKTIAYLGYDQQHLYAVFLAFDEKPARIRARLSSREQVFEDDEVSIQLDTFNDQQRAYAFLVNPYGVQWDAIWTEGEEWDDSFDTVWHSEAALTPRGFVALIAIPFKSLRFPGREQQSWGLLLNRDIRHLGEETFWPAYSLRIAGRLNQMALLTGLEGISPGRNYQLIPYVSSRTFRELDLRDPLAPGFVSDDFDPDAGLDGKLVIRDSLVFDATLNPDFAQVESDEPQVLANRRFEEILPEKRPFFIENGSYFQTPMILAFTRRIVDPQFGLRLTGKLGRYGVGALITDDQAPGKVVPPGNPRSGERAHLGILRFWRDILTQSNVGLLLTERQVAGGSNRVLGFDTRLKLNENWTASGQAAGTWTELSDQPSSDGSGFLFSLSREGRNLTYRLDAADISPEFRAELGFVPRTDLRGIAQLVDYCFRPEVRGLICVGPGAHAEVLYDHDGTRLDLLRQVWFGADFIRNTSVSVAYSGNHERIRPSDFPILSAPRDFSLQGWELAWTTGWLDWLSLDGTITWGTRPNFVPPAGREPFLADHRSARLDSTVRPTRRLSIRTGYLFTGLVDRRSGSTIFDNHILRTRWNYQFTRELSLRMILQYDEVLPDAAFTRLETTRNFNADVLFTYLRHPGTALYVGYNTNHQNIDPALLVRTDDDLLNDGRQFFVKVSYLLRF